MRQRPNNTLNKCEYQIEITSQWDNNLPNSSRNMTMNVNIEYESIRQPPIKISTTCENECKC